MKRIVRAFAKFIARQRFLLTFLNGAILTALCFLLILHQYENEIYRNIAQRLHAQATSNRLSAEEEVVFVMNATHNLQQDRKEIFDNGEFTSIRAQYFCSADVHLMSALGACGSFSMVLSRVLQELGYVIRIGQMKVNGNFGGHIIVEALVHGRWIALDPLFNVYFKKPDGGYASFLDVSGNWNYYNGKTPAGYLPQYKYEDIRYTNWDRVPVLGALGYKTLSLLKGRHWADNFSFRPYFLNLYRVYIMLLVVVYIPILILTWFAFVLKRPLQGGKNQPKASTFDPVAEMRRFNHEHRNSWFGICRAAAGHTDGRQAPGDRV